MRNILGYTQEQLAFELDMSQQAFSDLEKKDNIDNKILVKIAELMKVPVETIKGFDENKAINFLSHDFNTYKASGTHQGYNVKHLRNMLGVSLDVLAVELNVTPQDILELEEQETLDEETLASLNTSAIHSQNCTFNSNPIDKLVELFEQKEKLYERMLKSEQEKNNTFLKLIEKK